jgi:hypothetical protein
MSDSASLITMIVYMGFIWPIVFYTLIRHRGVPEKINARIVFFAILFLITGDSALMITRIVSHFMYLSSKISRETGFVVQGWGLLSSSITMNCFYYCLYRYAVRHNAAQASPRYSTASGAWVNRLALFFVFARIAMVCFPQNNWFADPAGLDRTFRYCTNIPLYAQGLLAFIVLWNNIKIAPPTGTSPAVTPLAVNGVDYYRTTKKILVWMVISFICYTITMFGMPISPMFGMAMLPKSLAYMMMVYYLFRLELNTTGKESGAGLTSLPEMERSI